MRCRFPVRLPLPKIEPSNLARLEWSCRVALPMGPVPRSFTQTDPKTVSQGYCHCRLQYILHSDTTNVILTTQFKVRKNFISTDQRTFRFPHLTWDKLDHGICKKMEMANWDGHGHEPGSPIWLIGRSRKRIKELEKVDGIRVFFLPQSNSTVASRL